MDLVDEQDVVFVEIGQQGRQILGLFDGRAGGLAEGDAHFVCDDGCQGGLAQAGRAVEDHVVQRLVAPLGALNENGQVPLDLLLADVFGQGPGTQTALSVVVRQQIGGQKGLLVAPVAFLPGFRPVVVAEIDAHCFTLPFRTSRMICSTVRASVSMVRRAAVISLGV